MVEIYHNPRCSKSRQTLALINDSDTEVTIVEYLKDVPTAQDLKDILSKLDMSAEQLIRKGESIYKELYKGKELSEEEWIDAMVEYPKLIERPIVIKGQKAIIGRPPENVLTLL